MDVENLIPGSPAWRREIERSIRDAESIIRRVDGTDLRQLTDNGACDHQLRWGN